MRHNCHLNVFSELFLVCIFLLYFYTHLLLVVPVIYCWYLVITALFNLCETCQFPFLFNTGVRSVGILIWILEFLEPRNAPAKGREGQKMQPLRTLKWKGICEWKLNSCLQSWRSGPWWATHTLTQFSLSSAQGCGDGGCSGCGGGGGGG